MRRAARIGPTPSMSSSRLGRASSASTMRSAIDFSRGVEAPDLVHEVRRQLLSGALDASRRADTA